MDHYFLLLEEETKNRHSQQLKVLQSQARACKVGIITMEQKSCARCGLIQIPIKGWERLQQSPGWDPVVSLSAGEWNCQPWSRWNRTKDTAAAASPASPDPACLNAAPASKHHPKPPCKPKTQRALPPSRAWWWSGFYKAEHVKIKRRGQEEKTRERSSSESLYPVKQPSLVLGWMDFFFLFRIILRSSIKNIQSNRSMLVQFSPGKFSE